MFGDLGIGEILMLLLLALLLFGAKRIPEVAGSLGKGIREFKRSVSDVQNQITRAPSRGSARGPAAQPGGTHRRGGRASPEPKRLLGCRLSPRTGWRCTAGPRSDRSWPRSAFLRRAGRALASGARDVRRR